MQALQGCKLCYHAKLREEASFSSEAPQGKLEPPSGQAVQGQAGKLGEGKLCFLAKTQFLHPFFEKVFFLKIGR